VGAAIPFDYSSARAQGSGNLGQRAEGQGAGFIPVEGGNAKAGHVISNKKLKNTAIDVLSLGTIFFDCTAILCDYCELADHKS
jgi:hypothetical protein